MSLLSDDLTKTTHMLNPWTQTQVSPEVFDFGVGQPGPDLLEEAFKTMKLASESAFSDEELRPWLMQYGHECGSPRLREAMARFYKEHAGAKHTKASEVIMSTGVSSGLQLLGTSLAKAGDYVIVEQPTYFLARVLFEGIGLKVLKAPMTDSGSIDFDKLSQAMIGKTVKLLYVVPVHSNPTAKCHSLEDKTKIIEFAKNHGITILADEVYELLNFNTRSSTSTSSSTGGKKIGQSPPFREICQDSHVISVSSFSKICGPGLRLGWILASEDMVERVRGNGIFSSGGGMNPIVAAMMCHALENRSMDKLLVDAVQPSLRKRAMALCDSITLHLEPLGCSFHKPEGGYFVFLTFEDETVNTSELLGIAMEKFKVKFTPGERCFGSSNTMRLSFSFYDSLEMDEGIQRLKAAIEYYNGKKSLM